MLPLLLALGSAAGAGGAGGAGATGVPVGDRPVSADLDGPATLRSGVVIGGSLGVGMGGAAGYPNDSSKIGDGRYYLSGGTMVETSETIFLMGALADYLSFGVWYSHASFDSSGFHARGDAGGLRLEVFPLVRLARLFPPLSRLGFLGEFGIGQGKLTSSSPGVQIAEGTQSFLAAGAFYEWPFGHLIGGHFAAGPSLEYDSMWSQSFGHEGLVATARLVFYGGP